MTRKKTLNVFSLITILFICLFSITRVYAGVAEDIITHHKLDMNKKKDRQSLLWIIEHDYPKQMKKMNVKYYHIVFAYHKKGYEQKDFVVNETKQGVVATHIHDDMAFFILKLSNGVSIARGFDGYYVPITHIKLNAASDKMIEAKNNVLLAFDKKPKGAKRYYRIKDGLVYEGDTNQYLKQ